MTNTFKKLPLYFLAINCMYATGLVAFVINPHACNDAATTYQNVSVDIAVLANDIPGLFASLNPATVSQVSAPSNGSISINGTTGVITYSPNAFYLGADSFVYQVCDTNEACTQATVYVTVEPVGQPCPTDCDPECCIACFDKVNECMCTLESFAQFSAASGTWNQVPGYISTSAPAFTLNFLKYNHPVSQTYEEISVKLSFPSNQPVNSQFTSAGLVTNWNGTAVGFDNQKVAYISFDNNSGNPQNAKLAVGGINTENIYFLPFQIQYDTLYTLRIIKNQQIAHAFINDMFIGSANTGIVTGNFVGVWSYQASVQFSDLKSCSYTNPLPVPSSTPFEPVDIEMFPV